jgi:NADH-quinone oxidoreductase subunit M
MLLSLVLIPLFAATAVAIAGKRRAFPIAVLGTLLPVGMFAALAQQFDWGSGGTYQFTSSAEWLPALGLSFSIGVDSVSMLLLGLTALLGPICVIGSLTAVTKRVKTYYFWLLVLQAAMSGVFMSRDVILFYIFFEFTLVPMFVLISLYGSTNRKAAAIKFFLYTFTGSVLALAGLVFVAYSHAQGASPEQIRAGAGWTFDVAALQAAAQKLSPAAQGWVFLALMAGFAVKVPLFPVHTWLPLAHTEAPTAGSVVLAGVLLKLGTYGILVFAIPFAPAAALHYAVPVAVLSIVGILFAGLICWVQTDVKKLVAYSSVAHLGFCVLGMFSFNASGLQGSILYMINHGLSTGAMFLCIGMIYERYHTRSMKELGGLAKKMPVWGTFMVFFAMCSVGLPGTNGFISEFLCLLGAFQSYSAWPTSAPGSLAGTPGELGPVIAAVAGTGMIVAAIYILYMVGRVCFGPLVEPHHHHDHADHGSHAEPGEPVLPTDLSVREIGVLAPLAVLCLVLGVYPKPLLSALEQPVQRTARLVDMVRPDLPAGKSAGGSGEASVMGGGPASRAAAAENHP